MTTPFLPADYSPAGDVDNALDDSYWWPGAVELEHIPAGLDECDGCHALRECVVIERPGCNVYLCSDCLHEYIEGFEETPVSA